MLINDLLKSNNILELIDQEEANQTIRAEILTTVLQGFDVDFESGEEYRDTVKEAMLIAKQVQEHKSFPWDGASNIKYPLICEAAINFASRTYPELVPSNNIVSMSTGGVDPTSENYHRGRRVAKCMSYQCATSSTWSDNVDRLLHILPVVGTVFTKTYFSDLTREAVTDLCGPDDIIVNHNSTKSLEDARRISHLLHLSLNDIKSYQSMGLYDESVDLITLCGGTDTLDPYREVILIEQHCFLDLDEDGYYEPYIVTFHKESHTLLRIVSRAKKGGIRKNSDGKIICIKAECFFQDYHFIRSPDAGFYSIGFGTLLLPLNKAINSLINQLVDAGTLSVMQGGFLGRGLRLKASDLRFKPFEWKVLDAASGIDLKEQVFPFPVREPSNVLMSLLTFLVDIGKQLTASTDVMNGAMTPTNVSSGALDSLRQEGRSVLSAINKRLWSAMSKSFKKLYEINHYHLTNKEYNTILESEGLDVKMDFRLDGNNAQPVADQALSTVNQRMQKVAILGSLRTADPRALDTYILETMQIEPELIQVLLPPPDPNAPPPPEAMKMMADAALSNAKAQESAITAQITMQSAGLTQAKMAKDIEFIDSQIGEAATRGWKSMKDAAHNDEKMAVVAAKMAHQEQIKKLQLEQKLIQDRIDSLLKSREIDLKYSGENSAKPDDTAV